jgi:hypothetical protein
MDTLCRYCGREVTWATSKAGKRYLAEPTAIFGDNGNKIKEIMRAHYCTATESEKQAIDDALKARNEEAIERGEIVVGQHVVIFKGRKYPIGTTGIVDWVAREADQYGVTKVRVVLNDGTKIYVNRENLKVAAVA